MFTTQDQYKGKGRYFNAFTADYKIGRCYLSAIRDFITRIRCQMGDTSPFF